MLDNNLRIRLVCFPKYPVKKRNSNHYFNVLNQLVLFSLLSKKNEFQGKSENFEEFKDETASSPL